MTNAGLIESTGGGVLTLAGSIANTGTLAAAGGTVTVTGPVTGTGLATINGGTLDFTATFSQNVTFTGATGVLELAKSQSYTGAVTGFSKSGGTSLDLADIGFVGAGEATYVGTKTGGVLTVTDGTHTAHITLIGNYLHSTFIAASDGHGGVIVHDPRAGRGAVPAATQPLISAMASLGAAEAPSTRWSPRGIDASPVAAIPRHATA